jgi:hypothetical protein
MNAVVYWGTATLGDGITRTIKLDVKNNLIKILCWRRGIDRKWQLMATTDIFAWAVGYCNQMLGRY